MPRSAKRTPRPTAKTAPSPRVGRRRPAERRVIARDVRPDSRNRISLGPVLKSFEGASFTVYLEKPDKIVLEPQVSVPASEAWLFKNRAALESLRRGFEDAAAGRTRSLGSFAKYADDDES